MWKKASGSKKKWIQNSFILGAALLFIVLISTMTTDAAPNAPAPPDPAGLTSTDGNGAFKTGNYRNLFVESGNYSDAQVDARLQEIWDQLFYGTDNQRIYYPTGTDEAFILDVGSNDIRSEGMSYGMMIAVQMNKQEEFDRLWRWAYNHMYHKDPSHPNYGYFSWEIKPTAPFDPCDENPAPDGEEYFAMALYFADGRWGSETGTENPLNYQQWADKIVTDMVTRETKSGTIVQIGSPGQNCATSTANPRTVTTLGMMHPTEKKIRFSTDSSSADWSDPSYHLPAFYDLFSRWAPTEEVRLFWADAAQESRDYFLEATNDTTCLNPDYANWDGSPKSASWNSDTVHFQYDAWRTAMNWGLDYSWWAKDGRQQDLSNCIQAFFESEGLATYGNRYTLAGSILSQDHSPGLVSTNAATGLAATDIRAWDFVDSFWNTAIPTGQWRYYDGMLYMLSYLQTSGHYRIYTPGTPPEPTPTPDPNVTPTAVPPTNTPVPPTATNTPAPAGSCVVVYDVVNQWNTGFQANIDITNNESTSIQGWTLTWTHAPNQTVTAAWNVDWTQTGNDVSMSAPASQWNGTIPANGTLSFSYQGEHPGTVVIPTDFVLNGTRCNEGTGTATATSVPPTATSVPPTATTVPPTATSIPSTATAVPPTATTAPPTATSISPTATAVPPTATSAPPTATSQPGGDCVVAYDIPNDWGQGFTGGVTISNNSSSPINDWTLQWEFTNNQSITSSWKSQYSQSGNAVTVTHDGWNSSIAANGGSVDFGFNASYSGTNGIPTSFVLNGTTCTMP